MESEHKNKITLQEKEDICENQKYSESDNFENFSNKSNNNKSFSNYDYNSDDKNPVNSNMRDFIANDKKGKSIHSKFLYLKRQLNLGHFMRKTQIDSLLKKCKSKAFKNIHEALRKCLSVRLERLPQLFITNIKIDFNKYYLSRSILEIYQEFNIIKSLDDLVDRRHVIESRKKILEDFLSLTFKQVYEYYINSHQFKKDYLQISEREGQKFAILFSYIAQIFIQYYQKSRGNKKRNAYNKKNKYYFNRDFSDEDSDDFYDYENNFDDDNDNIEEKNNKNNKYGKDEH